MRLWRFGMIGLALALCFCLFACQKAGQGNEKNTAAATAALPVPAGVTYISISLIDRDGGGYAPIPREQLGVIRQLCEEAKEAVLSPLPAITDKTFHFDNCFDVTFYSDSTSLVVSIDANDLLYADGITYTLQAGTLTYAHIQSYYNAFRQAE